jgi:hypothetical protein
VATAPPASRASWSGQLRLGSCCVPVKAYPTINSTAAVSLRQLHASCGEHIEYHKCCPKHGRVPADQIVKGRCDCLISPFSPLASGAGLAHRLSRFFLSTRTVINLTRPLARQVRDLATWQDGDVPMVMRYTPPESVEIADFPAPPDSMLDNPASLLTALRDASETAEPASIRFALDHLELWDRLPACRL